ncbi:RluA family pseudouridine synthase [Aquibacillus salsiterrae]|uniref:Pseudouridine synthase n=1 Tax=Aquibacillus salsiterrae TaxID=2950439 RepID=A0A9X3WCT9_9BACI|nr:RluA family pseudouridine synthase [Aquibacillus salsiterrae]MDC3417192.1 RluA family pseudouridine synthase [Aquibacillus salsiterrae]
MKFTIDKTAEGLLVREFLLNKGFSRRIIKAIKFQGGCLLVNGEPCTVRKQLHTNDVLEVELPQETRGLHMEPEKIPLNIVYEDEDVLVIDKPSGMATIPSFQHHSGTIANAILGYYEELKLTYTVHIVTRLDRDTTGLLLVAKHRFSHSVLSKDQKDGRVNRRYEAIIQGHLDDKEGIIDAPIDRMEGSIIQRTVKEGGQHAITHYRVKQETTNYSLIDVRLETGRTHQIRVHFSYLGHPLIGDSLYGGDTSYIKRQALHCKSLAFNHPMSKKRIQLSSSLPDDMRKIIKEN